ncbi:MAG: BREX protein BrxB domain-containing protein [Vulcanimicrobiota bacterium]
MSRTAIENTLAALRKDLLDPEGPRITNMRNFRFAILPYPPDCEFAMRELSRRLTDELKGKGWNVFELSAQRLLTRRLQSEDPEVLQSWIAREHRQFQRNPDRALQGALDNLEKLVGGDDGLAQDAVEEINRLADEHQVDVDKTLVWITRMGSLYPFFRTSTLLKHLDGKTRQIPVVVLYPGTQEDKTALSFMGVLPADRDYRPRIYSPP